MFDSIHEIVSAIHEHATTGHDLTDLHQQIAEHPLSVGDFTSVLEAFAQHGEHVPHGLVEHIAATANTHQVSDAAIEQGHQAAREALRLIDPQFGLYHGYPDQATYEAAYAAFNRRMWPDWNG